MLVKSDLASKDTSLWLSGICTFLIASMKLSVDCSLCWDILGDDLVDVLNFYFSSGYLTRTQRRGVISLSFKKGDRLDPRNWRPISLLNVDYKKASRAIAGRLLKVIHLVVSPDQ